MKIQFLMPRLLLISAGVLLGLAARFLWGPPEGDAPPPPREISRPLSEPASDPVDLPLRPQSQRRGVERKRPMQDQLAGGLVPPIRLPGQLPEGASSDWLSISAGETFQHDPTAIFESHGEQICASGCAVSRHPTGTLTAKRFRELLDGYGAGPQDESNLALETLLFYGAQTRNLMESQGVAGLDHSYAEFLWGQLQCRQARISLRVVDQQGRVRSWLDPSRVPLDRRHVFAMRTDDLPPLVTSGTVKRVGLNHVWVRL